MLPNFLKITITRYPTPLAAIALFLFSLIIYAGSLNNDFVWDDEGVITNAPEIRDFANIPSFFAKPLILGGSDRPGAAVDGRIRYYRPLTSTLHTLEYRLFGETPFGYKFVNLLLNGAVVVCAFLLIRAFTGETALAFLAALLYAATPARGEVVYWIYSDSHLLAGLFALLTMLGYHYGRTGLALGTMATGLLFQEGTILVFGALVVYQLTTSPNAIKGWRRLIPYLALAAGYLVLRRLVAGSVPIAGLDWLDRLRAVAYLVVKHLQITFNPDAPVTMYRYTPGMFGAGGVATPIILFAATLLAGAGVWLWWRQRRWFFWYAWFVVWIALSFNVGAYADYLLAEKTLYLASLGPCVLLVAWLHGLKRLRIYAIVLLLVGVGYQAHMTVSRGHYWTDTLTYLEKLLEFDPGYDIANYQLGVEYFKKRRYAEAITQFETVQKLRPEQRSRMTSLITDSYELWGQALAERGELDEALQVLQKARQLSPQRARIYNSLGIIYHLRGEIGPARAQWEAAVHLDPKNIEARQNLERFGSE